MDSSNSPDPTPSFAFRSTTPHNNNNNSFLRSHSTKEKPLSKSSSLLHSPPRLSCPTLSRSLQSSPLHPAAAAHHRFSPASQAKLSHHSLDPHQTTYHCASSALRNDGQILCLALSSNGLVYTGSDANLVRVWKLPEFTECGQLRTKACRVVALEVSNDTVYAAYGDGKIRVWRRTWDHKVLKHVRLATIPKTVGYVRSYISGKEKTMKHKGLITSMAINTAEDILYTASLDKTVKVWRISDLKCIETIKAHLEPINAIIVSDDGILYTASDDATVRVWRRSFCSHDQPHSLTVTLHSKHSPVKALTLTPEGGGILYGGCTDGYIHYWLKGWFAGQLQYGGSIQGHTHAVMCLASVANYVVSGSADSTCRVWCRGQDGQHSCVAVLVGHRGPIRCVTAFIGGGRLVVEDDDGDGCTVCSGSLDGVLKVWRVINHAKKNLDDDSNQCSSQVGANKYFELYKGFQ